MLNRCIWDILPAPITPATKMQQLIFKLVSRLPTNHIGSYMSRFFLFDAFGWTVRLHRVNESDSGVALHDHPWSNASFLLAGGYWEVVDGLFQDACERLAAPEVGDDILSTKAHTVTVRQVSRIIRGTPSSIPSAERAQTLARLERLGVIWRGPLSLVHRKAELPHRLIVPEGVRATSLFITAPKRREWGFYCPKLGWTHNQTHLSAKESKK